MPHNWILVGLSGSVTDVIGGMLATNVHGKDSWKNGNFSQNVISFKIMLADGTTKEIRKENDLELFNSIVGGLGFLGLITEITLKLKPIPSYMVEQKSQRITNFETLFDFFYSAHSPYPYLWCNIMNCFYIKIFLFNFFSNS